MPDARVERHRASGLVGEGWNGERRYAFAQGRAAKGSASPILVNRASRKPNLAALLKATHWVREVTNGCPEAIHPMSSAESAWLLIPQPRR